MLVRLWIGFGVAVFLASVQSGCTPPGHVATLDEVGTKKAIKELTGCTVPSQAYEFRGTEVTYYGFEFYASFRVPPEAAAEVLAAFQCEGVEELPIEMARGAFADGMEGAPGNLFDPSLLLAVGEEVRSQVTGPVRAIQFRPPDSPKCWFVLMFEEKGLVYFSGAVNPVD